MLLRKMERKTIFFSEGIATLKMPVSIWHASYITTFSPSFHSRQFVHSVSSQGNWDAFIGVCSVREAHVGSSSLFVIKLVPCAVNSVVSISVSKVNVPKFLSAR